MAWLEFLRAWEMCSYTTWWWCLWRPCCLPLAILRTYRTIRTLLSSRYQTVQHLATRAASGMSVAATTLDVNPG
eukprot:CAMPEP_0172400074 /NCGR_PEP_ID=MMETSP1061-20121228/44006_1 /TAXON_ID=37318 /ORGANISM="Pseudo-nitzschia pungens, Strain cf. pungens" /LENGTH=73 /DNA_ID=CAMNT_0013133179 /DNA_START=31 /DNA_END=248 /DNA_ORIENTATION=-